MDQPEDIDEIAVERRLAGDRVKLNYAERKEAVRRGYALLLSDSEIAARLHYTTKTVWSLRKSLGLPARYRGRH